MLMSLVFSLAFAYAYHMTRTALRALSLQRLLMKVPYEGRTHQRRSGPEKDRTALLQKHAASRVKNSRQFVFKLDI